jgi:hypothetical protein
MALSVLSLKTVSSPPCAHPCRKTHTFSEARPQVRGKPPALQTRHCLMANRLSRNGPRERLVMDHFPSDTAETERWPPVSIVYKRVRSPLFNNAHNADATRALSGNRVPERPSETQGKLLQRPERLQPSPEPVGSRFWAVENLQTLFTIPGLGFCLARPTNHKSSDDADGTILSGGAEGATAVLHLMHPPSQLCLATRRVGSPVS